ncbi:hypothetical protein [Pseudomonas sp. EA_35y_Pfl2_R5]|uniref:hypothetical protein n=1 Tax=Pseudomonas sp. EA_35y_Pfl2_R5 TaxID=3088690 RepID=UPI0030D8266E
MNRITFAAVLCGQLMAGLAQADDCRQHMPTWLERAYPGHVQGQPLHDERGSFRLDDEQSICKVWPARPHLTLLAVSLLRTEEDGHGESDLEVLVLDSVSQAIIARHVEPNLLDWDAIFVDGLEFDTAPYRLREGDLAFGIRVKRRSMSRANPFYETSLSLYELKEPHLRPVLSELVMDRSGGEWDTRCAGEFSDTRGVLVITERLGNKGYHDLLLKQTRTDSRAEMVAQECETVEENLHRQQHRLEYDEQRYLLPIELVPI